MCARFKLFFIYALGRSREQLGAAVDFNGQCVVGSNSADDEDDDEQLNQHRLEMVPN